MLHSGRIDAIWGPGALAELEEFIANSRLHGAVLSLFKTADEDAGARWSYGVLMPERVQTLSAAMAACGQPLLYSLNGLTVAISNAKHARELDGMALMLDGPGQLFARARDTAR
jgi:hypothetical protein